MWFHFSLIYLSIYSLNFQNFFKVTFDSNLIIITNEFFKLICGTTIVATISPILVNYLLHDLFKKYLEVDFQVQFLLLNDILIIWSLRCMQIRLISPQMFPTSIWWTPSIHMRRRDRKIYYLGMIKIKCQNNFQTNTLVQETSNSDRFMNCHLFTLHE